MGDNLISIASALLGAFAGGALTFFTAVKNGYNKSIISEREKWREKVRTLTARLAEALDEEKNSQGQARVYATGRVTELRRQLEMRLNPDDPEDQDILKESDADRLSARVALMLKHDWQRAKIEVSTLGMFFKKDFRPTYGTLTRGTKQRFYKYRSGRVALCAIAALLLMPYAIEAAIAPFVKAATHAWLTMTW